MTDRSRTSTALVVVLAICMASTGCASLGSDLGRATPASITTGASLGFDAPVFRRTTSIERQGDVDSLGDVGLENEKATPIAFWTGIGLGALGTVGTIGFGTAGLVTESRLRDGYEGEGFTRAERDDLEDRGKLWNTMAATSAAIGLAGFTMALIVYAIDYTRCGPLSIRSKRRNCPPQ